MPCAPGTSSGAIPTHDDALPLHRGATERVDHRVDDGLGNLDEREAVGDLDGADRARVNAGLVRDRADQIGGPDARLATGTDVDARRRPLFAAAPAPTATRIASR